MPTIRITEKLMKEIQEFLKLKGKFIEGTSLTRQVEAALSLAFYGTTDLTEGRNIARRLAEQVGEPSSHGVLRGKVAAFAESYDWQDHKLQIDQGVVKEFAETTKEINEELCLSVEDCEISDEPLPPISQKHQFPPWQGLARLPLDDIQKEYPRHKLIDFALVDTLHQLAVECAFAALPASLRKSKKVFELTNELYRQFKEYKDGDN